MKASEKVSKAAKNLVPQCMEGMKSLMEKHGVQYIPYKHHLIDRIAIINDEPCLVLRDGGINRFSLYEFDMSFHLSWLIIVEDYFDNVPNKSIGFNYETIMKTHEIYSLSREEYTISETESEIHIQVKNDEFVMDKKTAMWHWNGKEYMTFTLLFIDWGRSTIR